MKYKVHFDIITKNDRNGYAQHTGVLLSDRHLEKEDLEKLDFINGKIDTFRVTYEEVKEE